MTAFPILRPFRCSMEILMSVFHLLLLYLTYHHSPLFFFESQLLRRYQSLLTLSLSSGRVKADPDGWSLLIVSSNLTCTASLDLAHHRILLGHIYHYPALENLHFQKSLGLTERHMFIMMSLSRESTVFHSRAEWDHS